MAVIKIVPMPGAVGDKGDEGAVGPQGQQGERGLQGVPGVNALWSYQGAYNSSAAYAVGDVVVYQGQLYYTKSVTTAGTLPTDTAKFDLIASKGADGQPGTNGSDGADALWNFTGPWVNGTDYAAGSVVEFEGSTYYHPLGQFSSYSPPTNGWVLVSAKGADAELPTGWTGTINTEGPMLISVVNGIITEVNSLT